MRLSAVLVALVLAVLIVTVGYLYLTRFCDACGRMVRNLKVQTCPRCGGYLPRHGMTARLRQPGDERGWTPRLLSVESVRHALARLKVSWQRAKHWITSPDPAYARKKKRVTD